MVEKIAKFAEIKPSKLTIYAVYGIYMYMYLTDLSLPPSLALSNDI